MRNIALTIVRRLHVCVFIAVCGAISSLAAAAALRGEPSSVISTPPDMTYFAQQGDTLSSIAKKFTDKTPNWKILSKRNHIEDDRAIPVGTPICIPLELLPEEQSEARIIALAGTPGLITSNGNEQLLAIGMILKEGAQIRTGKNGFLTLALPDESRISIPSNSQLTLSKLRKTKFTSSPRTQLSLSEGKVESRVSSLASNKGRFEVSSPLAIAGVRGTHFRVGVSENATANEVLEGGVAVGMESTAKQAKDLVLPAGKGNIISASGVGQPVDLLPPPVLDSANVVQTRPTLQFSAQASANAAAYRVQIARDAQAIDILMENQFKDNRFKFDGLDDGNYYLRATAIDKAGLEGLPAIQAFTLKARPEPPFTIQPKNKLRSDKVDFVWTESNNAHSYHLQVAKDHQFQELVLDRNDLKEVQYSSNDIALGDYFWRIATVIEKNGRLDQGPYSDPQSFVKLPAQAAASFAESEGKEISFNWIGEAGQKFLIQIAKDPEFKTIYLSKELTEAQLQIPRPDAGQYYIRVKATDPDGYIGKFSATQKITINARWVSSDGQALTTSSGVVRTGF
jgi:hypothetical protein